MVTLVGVFEKDSYGYFRCIITAIPNDISIIFACSHRPVVYFVRTKND